MGAGTEGNNRGALWAESSDMSCDVEALGDSPARFHST